MKIVNITYTTKTEFAVQNQQNIQQVMTDLQQLKHPDLLYHACLKADGKTFVHTAFFKSEEAQQVLFDLASFKHFQQALKASAPETPPQQELLTLVGVSQNMF